MNAVEILEQALSEAWEQYPGCKKLVPESLVREALAALEAEGVGLPWVSIANQHPHPHDDVVLWSDFHGRWLWDRSWAELHRATHWLPLSAIPLPGQSPEPSAGLREAVEDLLWRRNNEQFTDEEWPDKLIEALNADAALRAEEQSHE